MEEASLIQFFNDDFDQMVAGNLDAMMANYHPDAQVIRLPNDLAQGKDEIRAFFKGYIEMHPEIIEVLSIKAHDNCLIYHSTVKIGDAVRDLVGTWVLRDGLIWRQTAAFVPAE